MLAVTHPTRQDHWRSKSKHRDFRPLTTYLYLRRCSLLLRFCGGETRPQMPPTHRPLALDAGASTRCLAELREPAGEGYGRRAARRATAAPQAGARGRVGSGRNDCSGDFYCLGGVVLCSDMPGRGGQACGGAVLGSEVFTRALTLLFNANSQSSRIFSLDSLHRKGYGFTG